MSLAEELIGFPLRTTGTPQGRIGWRAAGSEAAPVVVLLHGIGSASASWIMQLGAARAGELPLRLLAWDAPGYGPSEPLPMAQPSAADYAARLWAWLDAMDVGVVALAGHSLGAMMAAAAARLQPARVRSLLLLSPAQGYGRAEAGVREGKLRDRLHALHTLGPQGMAERRGAAMLSAQARQDQVAFIQGVMAQIDPAGYTQAAQMLSGGDIASDLAAVSCPITVASGSADIITPPQGCEAVATGAGAPYQTLGPVGHACALEAAPAVTRLLAQTAP